ncbi:hypothetical protein GGQ80_003232 [Sphingomonas jinjuensis]|uniref:Uncharacterized protein n=2 Tax=Sphingomonas jinjuensis TaxID=535907 RepID=A0A840FF60_9SPHN|nr:hypothetical protein [Sphingomonas jinjuensis]
MLTQLDLSPIRDGMRLRQQGQALENEQSRIQTDQMRLDAQLAEKQAAATRKQQFFDAFAKVSAAPNAAGYNYLRGNFPDFLDPIDAAQKSYRQGGLDVMRNTAGGVISALTANDPQRALTALDDGSKQLAGSDMPADTLTSIRGLVESGKPEQLKAARKLASLALAQASGDRFNEVYSSLNREDREEELHPYRLRQAQGNADYSETRAEFAPADQEAAIAAKRARVANTASIIDRRNRTPIRGAGSGSGSGSGVSSGPRPVKIRPGEAVAQDGQGKLHVARGGKWVEAVR